MINLLPPEYKKRNLMEKRKRVVAILWTMLSVAFLCLLLLLFLARVYLNAEVQENDRRLSSGKVKEYSFIKSVKKRAQSYQPKMARLAEFYRQKVYFSEILESLEKHLPVDKSIYLTDLSLTTSFSKGKEKKKIIKVSLAGYAAEREGLYKFMEGLKEDKMFREVNFPSDNWVKAKDINFSAELTFNQK